MGRKRAVASDVEAIARMLGVKAGMLITSFR